MKTNFFSTKYMGLWGITLLLVPARLLKAQVAEIPFSMEWKYAHIKVKIAGSDSLNFMFDSGATCTSVDSLVAEKTGLSKNPYQMVDVMGLGSLRQNKMIMDQSISLADGLSFDHINLVIIDYRPFAATTRIPLDGVIGYDILSHFVTLMNFDQHKLSFYNRIDEVDLTGYTAIPFTFINGNLPHIPISITLSTGETLSGQAMFDLGAAITLMITPGFNQYYGLSAKMKTGINRPGMGINAAYAMQPGSIKSMKLAGLELGAMPVNLTGDGTAKPDSAYLGILGMDVLSRFTIVFDYFHNRLYLKPDQKFQAPFEGMPLDDKTAQSEAFLKANRSKAGINCTPSGLQYHIIEAGTGTMPLAGDKVKLYFNLSLLDGTSLGKRFDSQTPWIHHIDKALPGMQEALTKMRAGSKWLLYLPASLAFGDVGTATIPPGSLVICELELVQVNPPQQPLNKN